MSSQNDTGPQPKQVESKKDKIDYERLVVSLMNSNAAPIIRGEAPNEQPLFPEEYNWQEQERVLRVIQDLADHAGEAWEPLIMHLDDKDYSVTLDMSMSVANYSVGNISWLLLTESITE